MLLKSSWSIFQFIGPDTKIYLRDKTDNLYTYLQTFLVRCTMHNIFLIALKQTHQSIKLSRYIICMPSWLLIFKKTQTKAIQQKYKIQGSFTNDVSQNLVFVNISEDDCIPPKQRRTCLDYSSHILSQTQKQRKWEVHVLPGRNSQPALIICK